MEEIASQFYEELQELLDRYKNFMSVPHIIHVIQDVFHKTLSVEYHPELHSKEIIKDLLKCLPKENIEGVYEATEAAEQFLRDTNYTKPTRSGSEPNAFSGPNAICMQGPDGCCTTYKSGWDKCKGCGMYNGESKCID